MGKVESGLLLLEKSFSVKRGWEASEAEGLVESFELIVHVGLLLRREAGDVAVEDDGLLFNLLLEVVAFDFLGVRNCCFVPEVAHLLNSTLGIGTLQRLELQKETENLLQCFLWACSQIFKSEKEMWHLFRIHFKNSFMICFDVICATFKRGIPLFWPVRDFIYHRASLIHRCMEYEHRGQSIIRISNTAQDFVAFGQTSISAWHWIMTFE